MATTKPSTISDRTFDTLLASLEPTPRNRSVTNSAMHSLGLCEVKLNLLMQDYHDLSALPQDPETVPGEKEDLQRAVQTMTLKNKVLNGQIMLLTAELAAITADVGRGRMHRMDQRENPFSPVFRTSTLKLREYGHLMEVERHLRELGATVSSSAGGVGIR